MDILPPSKPGERIIRSRPASNVILRPIAGTTSEPVKTGSSVAILPSIRSAMGGAGVISHVGGPTIPTLSGTAPVSKKKGRPTKAEKMRERRARVSEDIKALVDDDPTKADVHAYFESRIKALLDN